MNMDDDTRQAFKQTAQAFGETAQAFQRTAQAFENTAEAFAPSGPTTISGGDRGGSGGGSGTTNVRAVLNALLVAVSVVVLIIALWPPPPPPEPFHGIDVGLVFARCDQPMLGVFRPSVELWAVDPDSAAVIEEGRTAVDLPANSRLAYPCDGVGGLTRRLFDAGFRRTVIQARDPETGAEHVRTVTLTSDHGTEWLSPGAATAFSSHPHDGLAVFGPGGRKVWYRSANDGSVRSLPDTSSDDVAATIDPRAEAFTVLTEEPPRFFVQGDRTTDPYAADLALPNRQGDMAAAPGILYLVDEQFALPLRCSSLVMDVGTACLDGDLGVTNAIRPAAWLDDRTLLAINGPSRGANTLLRIEIGEDGELRGCPAMPASDWSYRAVAVEPGGDTFVTDAVRNGKRMLFYYWSADAADNQPSEQPAPDVPNDASLTTWQPDTAPRGPVPHVCGAPR